MHNMLHKADQRYYVQQDISNKIYLDHSGHISGIVSHICDLFLYVSVYSMWFKFFFVFYIMLFLVFLLELFDQSSAD